MSEFLYPTSIRYPFDATCTDIVKGLEAKNWQVPGINVAFYKYSAYRYIESIESQDFMLRFGRAQGRLTHQLNNTAAVSTLNIPRQQLDVYEDNSGPRYYRYVGLPWNWYQDRENFVHWLKVNSKLHGKPRTYLIYKGAWKPQGRDTLFGGAVIIQHPWEAGIAPYLVHDNDLGREYDPRPWNARYYETRTVMEGFDKYLKEKVLPRINS